MDCRTKLRMRGTAALAAIILSVTVAFSADSGEKLRREILETVSLNHTARAESLFQIADSRRLLGPLDLLQWSELKEVMAQYTSAAHLLCRSRNGDPGLERLVQSRLTSLLKDTPIDTVRRALVGYQTCCLAGSTDTVNIRRGVARIYSQLGYPDDQARVLVELETPGSSSGPELLELAQMLLAQGDCARARATGVRAFERLSPARRSDASFVVFGAFSRTGPHDSALAWLDRVLPNSSEKVQAAIVFYQWAGNVRKADSLIHTLAPSVNRDTLRLRQFFFEGRNGDAAALARRMGEEPHWKPRRSEYLFWKARALLFAEEVRESAALCDSLSSSTVWGSTQETLSYCYGLELAGSSEKALQDLAKVEYAVFVGKPQLVSGLIGSSVHAPAISAHLAVRAAGAFVKRARAGDAVALLEKVPAPGHSPEYRYCLAQALILAGHRERGRGILELLMLEFPDDVFSGKARLVLAGLGKT